MHFHVFNTCLISLFSENYFGVCCTLIAQAIKSRFPVILTTLNSKIAHNVFLPQSFRRNVILKNLILDESFHSLTYWVFGMGTNELKNPLKTIKIEFIYRILIQTLKMEKGLKKIFDFIFIEAKLYFPPASSVCLL